MAAISAHIMLSEPSRPSISFVIATCSRSAQMRGALQSLFAQTGLEALSLEMVVVDDQSTDDTLSVLQELAATAPFPLHILHGAKSGVAAARNLAASHAQGEWLVSFDDDELAEPDWLAKLYAAALANNVDAVGGDTILSLPNGLQSSDYGPRARRLLGETAPGGSSRAYPVEILPATNNVMLRRSLFEELNGYDTRFVEGGEDTDFFYRARLAGKVLWLEPAAVVHHLIPERRTTPHAIALTAKRIGVAESRMFRLRGQRWNPYIVACKRISVTLFRDLPTLALAKLQRNARAASEAHLSLAYTGGLLRSLLGSNEKFAASMDFRIRHGERSDATKKPL
ncbi:MAG: glycosyltransferase [Acidobacteriaceae bacterium]|nr:glycosyltransferase [Acidobacteriaceae bacterium]